MFRTGGSSEGSPSGAAAGRSFREQCRSGAFRTATTGVPSVEDNVQGNLVILPKEFAFEFLTFCLKNAKSCPLLDVSEVGSRELKRAAEGGDVTKDCPLYDVFVEGKKTETVSDVSHLWQDDSVAFLLGCSFSWEKELARAGLTPRHVTMGRNVPMYRSNIPLTPVGPFKGTMVVSMRPYRPSDISSVTSITSRHPAAHGGPVSVGPTDIGIKDVSKPDFGDPVTVYEGEETVYWACGVTPQVAIQNAKPPLAITHCPGHMLVTDWTTADFSST